ncbi:hypothetical protein [Sphingomonas sp. G-3-2-10]|uniref:hypothetical protein n=1 Tax=Sphingomonas sp. G-3-2-10 TaxID=2728838 RepID=UPI00146D8949|nr:hypothetical protein [Sphingomonas sp. G-3-2-10]NML05187.1 hypothetical protein [Sphingomonas sp. G-3-2-10]
MRAVFALLLLLAGCSGDAVVQNAAEPQDLEKAAIERGLVRDPKDTEIAGLYARDTDRVCIVPDGNGYKIGAFVDYGDKITCSGSGTVSRVGEVLRVEMGEGEEKCGFDARFEGDKILFPGNVPDTCSKLCAKRASYAGLEVSRISESEAEAAAMRDSRGRSLCGK